MRSGLFLPLFDPLADPAVVTRLAGEAEDAAGADHFANEYSITGEELDDRRRARMLDEALEILVAARAGDLVHQRGERYTVEGTRFLPQAVERPRVPLWAAGPPVGQSRCAAPSTTTDSFPSTSAAPTSSPRSSPASTNFAGRPVIAPPEPYDVVAVLEPGIHPAPDGEAGTTWWLVAFRVGGHFH